MIKIVLSDIGLEMPKFEPLSISPELITKLLAVIIVVICLFYIYRLNKYRILVVIYEYVHNSYVSRRGRYCSKYDKETKASFLEPLGRGHRLPMFNTNNFHKVNGMPFIGIMRSIKLIKQNRWTYSVIKPPENESNFADITPTNSKEWVWSEIERTANIKLKTGDFLYYLAIYAPIAIIIFVFGLFFVGLYYDSVIMTYMARKIETATNLIMNYAAKKGI